MSVFELHATSARSHAARAIASVAFAIAIVSGVASAESPAPEPSQSEAAALGQPKKSPIQSTPSATDLKPAKRQKLPSKPFTPTERIEADSVISFPANI